MPSLGAVFLGFLLFFLIVVLVMGLLFLAGIGLFVLWHIFRGQKSPADNSNRINKIRLVWFALTREELFTDVFPWLTNDEHFNVKNTPAEHPHQY